MQPLYTVTRPTSVEASDFSSIAESSVLDFLGFSTCSGVGVELSPVPLFNVSNISGIAVASALGTNFVQLLSSAPSISPNSSAGSTTPAPQTLKPTATSARLSQQAKIGIDVAVPITLCALLVGVALLTLFRRRKNKKDAAGVAATPEEEASHQPYLQQKSELEAGARQKHELSGEERIFELVRGNDVHEIATESNQQGMSSVGARQELRGAEHSQEMDASR